MFAVYATHADPNDPLAALKIGERPEPHVPEGWLRVKISHASLNRHDLFTLRGISGHPEGITYPIILGNDGAGTLDDGTPGLRFGPLAYLQRCKWIVGVSVRSVNCEHLSCRPSAGTVTHGMISNDAILSPLSSKKNRRFTGLPGKLPVSRLETTVRPSFRSHAKGSLV